MFIFQGIVASAAVSMPVKRIAASLQGDGLLDTNANMDAAVMATAVSLFPDPLQTANSEMLFNTMDPLSSINSTMNIHDTFEEGQVESPALISSLMRFSQTIYASTALSNCPYALSIPHNLPIWMLGVGIDTS